VVVDGRKALVLAGNGFPDDAQCGIIRRGDRDGSQANCDGMKKQILMGWDISYNQLSRYRLIADAPGIENHRTSRSDQPVVAGVIGEAGALGSDDSDRR